MPLADAANPSKLNSRSGEVLVFASHFPHIHLQECFTQGGSSGEALIAALLALLARLPARIEAIRWGSMRRRGTFTRYWPACPPA